MTKRMEAIEEAFPARERPLLVTGVVIGDPVLEATVDYGSVLVESGADVLELWVPFSDPIYHGPVLRRAFERAISDRITWDHVRDVVSKLRARHEEIPILISSYGNRLVGPGPERCVPELVEAGADGLNLVDVPGEEYGILRDVARDASMALIQSVAPTTSEKRFRTICEESEGMVIWQGHRGEGPELSMEEFRSHFESLKPLSSTPVVASMSVESAEEAREVASVTQGVMVSTSLAWQIEGRGPNVEERLAAFVGDLRQALDGDEG